MFGKNLKLSPTEVIFLLILKTEQSLSGSEIVQRINDQLGEDWKPTPGATYKILQSLQSKGFIIETTDNSQRKDQRIRTYTISESGIEIIPSVSSRFNKVLVFMNDCCPGCCDNVVIQKKVKHEKNSKISLIEKNDV